ncbi:MAG: hypothetical protein AAF411_05395 [Myxococcota bacterium]
MAFDPNKDRDYLSCAAVVSRLYKEVGGVPAAMEILSLSRTRCYALADPDDDAKISYERVIKLTDAGALAAAQHLAAVAGGVFLPLVDKDAGSEDWHGIAAEGAKESAALTAALLESLGPTGESPGAIDAREAKALVAQIDATMAVLARQRASLREVAKD